MNHSEVQPGAGVRAGVLAIVVVLCASCGGGGGAAPASAPPTPAPAPAPPLPPLGPNNAPTVVKAVPDQRAPGGREFRLDLSAYFQDPDGDKLHIMSVACWPVALGIVATPMHLAGWLPADGMVDVTVTVSDSRGGTAEAKFRVEAVPNAVPVVASPNFAVYAQAGVPVNYDPLKNGNTFTDGEGDQLAYELTLHSPSRGLFISGDRILGTLTGVGVVYFELKATDVLGASAVDRFAIAVAAPEPPEPVLPPTSYVYEDEPLHMPLPFDVSARFTPGLFWDTQPKDNRTTNAGATLGRVLFYDKRLSVTRTHSCGSCHQQANGFASPQRFDVGVLGVPLKRHSMALSNVRFNFVEHYFSDLRAPGLEALAPMPIEDRTELGSFMPQLAATLAATPFYPPLFEAAFGDREITRERIAKAIAQFLRTLTSYRSKFDVVYLGENGPQEQLLTPAELRGRILFTSELPCHFCHFTDVQQMFGSFNNGLDPVITDPGVITLEGPTGTFRAPSLRNIAVSAPYMHDGRFANLREVIDHYDHGVMENRALSSDLRTNLNHFEAPVRLNLSEEDKQALEAFLRTLTDDAFLTDPKFSDPFP